MFRSVLVAVDGSPASTQALAEAIDLARGGGVRLTLISVAAPARFLLAGPYVAPIATDEEALRYAHKVLARAEALVPDDVPVSTVVRRGPVAKAILDRVEAGGHDLVVMGSRGLGRLRALFVGSVSRAVVARSPVPVLIARAAPKPVDQPEQQPRERLATEF
jgi:nucleotide-binding universal stress UspA family protein